MTRQQPCDRRNFGHIRFEFLLLLMLLASVASLSAQTLKSSSVDDAGSSADLTSMQKSSSAPVSFGSVDDGVSGAVDAGVGVYSAAVGADSTDQFNGISVSSGGGGGGGKAPSSSAKFSPVDLMTKASSRGFSSGSLRSDVSGRAAPRMQAGYVLPVQSSAYTAASGAKTAYSPSAQAAAEQEELPRNPQSTDYESAYEGVGASFGSLEKIGGSLQSNQDSTGSGFKSLERLCGESCGLGTGSSAQASANTGTAAQSRAARLSAATSRLSGSVLASDSASNQLLGLETGRSNIKIGTSQVGRVRSGGASGGQQ